MHTAIAFLHDNDVTILARVLSNNQGFLPPEMARYLLDLEFSSQDKIRMHDLAVRNQENALSAEGKEELYAFARVGTVLAILKSRARCALKSKLKNTSM